MKTRKEIEEIKKDNDTLVTNRDLTFEILLDIRDLLDDIRRNTNYSIL